MGGGGAEGEKRVWGDCKVRAKDASECSIRAARQRASERRVRRVRGARAERSADSAAASEGIVLLHCSAVRFDFFPTLRFEFLYPGYGAGRAALRLSRSRSPATVPVLLLAPPPA
jgi:hypothetical protein